MEMKLAPDSWFLILVLVSVSVRVRVRNANKKPRIRNQPHTYILCPYMTSCFSINGWAFNIWSPISTLGGSKK